MILYYNYIYTYVLLTITHILAHTHTYSHTLIHSLISGLDNAGKSTILDRWITSIHPLPDILPNKICPTFGFEIKTLTLPNDDDDPIRLNFWDIGGQKTIRPFWRNYYEETDAIVWVVDSGDLDRLSVCRSELESVLNADVILK